MQLILNIENDSIAKKILLLLEDFKKEGLTISEQVDTDNNASRQEYSDQYIKEHWREFVMTHENPDVDDDERLSKAYIEYQDAKNSI